MYDMQILRWQAKRNWISAIYVKQQKQHLQMYKKRDDDLFFLCYMDMPRRGIN